MIKNLNAYKKIVGEEVVNRIYAEAEKFSENRLVCISSTYQGGGVAEILNDFVPLINKIGVNFEWRILHGDQDFFTITKKFHNALQGEKINLSERKKKIYEETNRRFSTFTHIKHHDLVIVHDPQPLPLIDFYKKTQPWIFRCHIDLSNPDPVSWNYLKKFIEKYDHFVVSMEEYKKNLNILQSVIHPAINPLSQKNKPLRESVVDNYLAKHGIERNKPIISQISRFDRWKDHPGVVKVFEKVREKTDCQLVLLGSIAADDPEGQDIFEKIKKRCEGRRYEKDIKILLVNDSILVNSLQRASSVVIQKSLKEGFGLTVSEALYKGTPVVASRVGGIPLQIINGYNGFLHPPKDREGFARSIIKLLKDEKLRKKMGKRGKSYVKDNFLITRLILDWFKLFGKYLK